MAVDSRLNFIANLLTEKGIVSKEKIDEIFLHIKDAPSLSWEALEELLIKKELVSEEKLLHAYSEHLGFSCLELGKSKIDAQAVSLIPAKFANRNKVIAVKKDGDVLTVAMRNPFEIQIIDELKMLTGLMIIPVLSRREDIYEAIKVHYGVGAETVATLVKDSQAEKLDEAQAEQAAPEMEKMAASASIINYVNQIILEAYRKRATDIHIEPFEHMLRIRYRVDGILQEVKTSPDIKKLQLFIISRLKIMANLDISERRRSQDGRYKIVLDGEDVDLRLSTFPTLFGEGISIRLLSKSLILLGIDQLGFPELADEQLRALLKKPNGIILVTGPTGCGKTTTLYACLNFINNPQVNIITLEDPIEYQLIGINQIQINPQVDLTFASGLRSILRQDPDIVMVGEIRDLETAQISIRAALTGHLIFSTLHTNDALATVTRLLDLGIEPYLVSGTVRAVIAQRLVRKICEHCRQPYVPDLKMLNAINFDTEKLPKEVVFYQGKGCSECSNTGYKGRTGIYELMIIDNSLSSLIVSGADREKLEKQALANGMITLKVDGLEKVKKGITTIEEILRVTEQE